VYIYISGRKYKGAGRLGAADLFRDQRSTVERWNICPALQLSLYSALAYPPDVSTRLAPTADRPSTTQPRTTHDDLAIFSFQPSRTPTKPNADLPSPQMADTDEATISIPSLVFVGILLFVAYRYMFASSSSSATSSGLSRNNNSNAPRFTAAQVETISAMFPQLNRRDIMWDLQRNRGSVQATTERLLTGRGLDPVCSFF
jgi:hypothetical protein